MEKIIAVVTIWDTQDNYGQILQCYALQKYLTTLGCNAFLLKTRSDTLAPLSLRKRMLAIPAKIFSLRFWELLYFRYKLNVFSKRYGHVDRGFDLFRTSYIKSSDKIFDINDLRRNCPNADIYITGSDQVWGAPSDIYFLNFVPEGKRKYSYAASFGSNSFNEENCKKMSLYLKTFNEVTVREYSGEERCKLLGIKAKRVIDPTGLLTNEEYLDIASLPDEKGYILLYLLGNYTDVNFDKIYHYANQKNISVKYVASQGRNDSYPKIFPSPTEWIGLIANASYVITNSYHCCLFSMYFRKKFMMLRLTGIFEKMNARMDTLFSQYKVPKVKSLPDLLYTPFNYEQISMLLEQDRNEAVRILNSWIKE